MGCPSLLLLDRPLQALPRGTLERALFKAVLRDVLAQEHTPLAAIAAAATAATNTTTTATATKKQSANAADGGGVGAGGDGDGVRRRFTTVARFEYLDDARDMTDRVVVLDKASVLEVSG